MNRVPLALLGLAIWMLLTATGVMIAASLPDIPDSVDVNHKVEVEWPTDANVGVRVDSQVDVDPGKLDFGKLRVDAPAYPN